MKKRDNLPTDQHSHNRLSTHEHKRKQKTRQVQRPRDWGQQVEENEDKNCVSYTWSIRNNQERIRSNLQLHLGDQMAIELQITLKSTAYIICTVLG